MKTKPIITHFCRTFGTLAFHKMSFFNTFLGLVPYWDYTPLNAVHVDSPGV